MDYIKKTMKKSVYESSKGWSVANERGLDGGEDNSINDIKIELEQQKLRLVKNKTS